MTQAAQIPFLAAEGGFPTWLLPETQVLIWSVIVFLALLALLWKFAWGPLMKALDEREKRIQKRIDDGEARLRDAESKHSQYEKRLLDIEDERRALLDKARQNAERVAAETQAKGRAEVDRLVERAKREISLAQAKAADDLKAQSVDMVIKVVEEVLDRHIKEDEHRQFVEECIEKYEKSAG
jgi:F-type H+-transporting ATPase subunit b